MLDLATHNPLPFLTTQDETPRAKLSAAPGEDGAPPDPQTEAAVDELNETIAEGPDKGQSWESWAAEVEGLAQQLNDQPGQCNRFNPPTTGECPLVGNLLVCTPPCIDEHRWCDITTLPFDEADGLYDLIYGPASPGESPDDDLDLVQYAWAVLLDNLDLVEWTACLFYGEPARDSSFFESLGELFGIAGSLAECLIEKIQGKAPDVTIVFSLEKDTFYTILNKIYIPWSTATWQNNYLLKFKRAAQGSADQFCIAADLAATLLHELVHSCWATSGSADHPPGTKDAANRCSTSYLIENSFRWALGQRYPCLGSSTDCNFYIKSCMWRNDGISYPGNSPC